MAKSLRSKSKRTARRAKRETSGSALAIQEAARLDRLNAKLAARTLLDPEPVHNSRDDEEEEEEGLYDFDALYDVLGLLPLHIFERPQKALWQELAATEPNAAVYEETQGSDVNVAHLVAADGDAMVVEGASEPAAADGSGKPISTHGPRNSGRERWRKSKGLAPRKKKNVNGPTNKQGVLPATKRAGRSKRRR